MTKDEIHIQNPLVLSIYTFLKIFLSVYIHWVIHRVIVLKYALYSGQTESLACKSAS